MTANPPSPPHGTEFEGDYRPAGDALLDPVNPRVEPADVVYLMKLTDALNTTLDLQTLLNRTSELVRAVIHYRIFAIFLLNDRTHELRMRFQIGHTPEVERTRLPCRQGRGGTGGPDAPADAAQRRFQPTSITSASIPRCARNSPCR